MAEAVAVVVMLLMLEAVVMVVEVALRSEFQGTLK